MTTFGFAMICDYHHSPIKAYGKFHPLTMIFCVSAKWETLMTLMQLLSIDNNKIIIIIYAIKKDIIGETTTVVAVRLLTAQL